jgi:hypothetical protein
MGEKFHRVKKEDGFYLRSNPKKRKKTASDKIIKAFGSFIPKSK